MKSEHHHSKSISDYHAQGNLKSYFIGFLSSILLTLAAYFLVVGTSLTGWLLYAPLVLLALTQMWVQVRFFLHLGKEAKPQWNLLAFLFMLLVISILVLGSLWIMNNLNARVMPTM